MSVRGRYRCRCEGRQDLGLSVVESRAGSRRSTTLTASTTPDMAQIPQALHKEIDECDEMELQQAQTWLLFRIHSYVKFFYTVWWIGIILTILGFLSFVVPMR